MNLEKITRKTVDRGFTEIQDKSDNPYFLKSHLADRRVKINYHPTLPFSTKIPNPEIYLLF